MSHVFLTAPPKVGKSTLINKVLVALGEPKLGGFRTVSVPSADADCIATVHLIPPCAPVDFGSYNLVGIRHAPKGRSSFPNVFDEYGCRLLEASAEAELLLMDELGMMENGADRFIAAVLASLDGDIPILGVVKPISTPFLDRVRSHPKVKVVEVTAANRDSLISPIIAELFA